MVSSKQKYWGEEKKRQSRWEESRHHLTWETETVMYGSEHGRLNSRRLPRLLLPGLYTLYNPLPLNVRTWIWWNITVMIMLHYMAERILQIQFRSLISWLWVHFKREFTLGGHNFIQSERHKCKTDSLAGLEGANFQDVQKASLAKGHQEIKDPCAAAARNGILPTIWVSLEEDSRLPIRKQPNQHLDFSLGRLNREPR